MNQHEYEEMFREEENAPAEAATSNQSENQKVPEQNEDITSKTKKPICDQDLATTRIMLKLVEVSAESIRHERFYDIAWHLEQIRRILEGEK